MAEANIKAEILTQVLNRGGSSFGWTNRTLTLEIERSNILVRFREDVKEKAEQTYLRHRYNVASADVDAVIAAGGIMTITRIQLLNKLRDKMLLTSKRLKA
jgi:hypothetical protein